MNRDILDTADSFLADLDDVLHDFGAKRAFENLFPLHEDDDEVGETFQKYGILPFPNEYNNVGAQTRNRCPLPLSHGLDEDPDYCTACYVRVVNNWARTEWLPVTGHRRYDEDSHYGYLVNPAQHHVNLGAIDKPFLLSYDQLGKVRTQLEKSFFPTTAQIIDAVYNSLSDLNADAFMYSVDFFGVSHFKFEANYGNEAITLEQLPGAFL